MIVRKIFFAVAFLGLPLTLLLGFFWPPIHWLLVIVVPYVIIGAYDLMTTKHNVLNNYPVLGHFRYMLEFDPLS